MIRINIVGKGKVGNHLYESFSKIREVECKLVNSRTLNELQWDANIVIIAVSDSAIKEVASLLKHHPGVVVHVSGSTPIEVIGRAEKGGVFYPLQSFSAGVVTDFSEIPIMIEATDSETGVILKNIASLLSTRIYEVNSSTRKVLHLAGVFSCNFANEMLAIAYELMRDCGLPGDLLEPLILHTIRKGLAEGPANVRTGPAVRNDLKTIEAQEKMLSDKPSELNIYRSVTERIRKSSEVRTDDVPVVP